MAKRIPICYNLVDMKWLNDIADELERRKPEGTILVESGASPSGVYHLGHLRELLTPDAILLELRRRGRTVRHIHFVDDLDALRKIPVNIPEKFEQFLGMPLCDIPSPDVKPGSYGNFFLERFITAGDILGIEAEYVHANERYRTGFMVPAIEKALAHLPEAKRALETISGRQLDENWSPIQVLESGRLKNRRFVSIDTASKTLIYIDSSGKEKSISYADGSVKLDWRLDWPGRWWLLGVDAEPFGRDHASAGGSYDTGVQIMKDVYEAPAPMPVPYDFINMAGDTKKMSASKGTGLDAVEGAELMPPEVVRYFVLGSPPAKRLYFDPVNGVVKLMDEYAALAAKKDKTDSEVQLLYICTRGGEERTVSRVPFSHLVACYQASLRDPELTLEVIRRTEHSEIVEEESEIITAELKFIDSWLDKRAPDEVKFALVEQIQKDDFSENELKLFANLAEKVASAPQDADGAWFHQAIYEQKDELGMQPKEMFGALYRLLINKSSGPRAGWFLSILPRDWLVSRLRLER